MPRDQKPDIEKLVWPKDGEKFQWIDRTQTILDVATKLGIAWLGYNAFEKQVKGSGLSGAIVSQIAMRLATANNLASGAAGVATLGGMGILNVVDPIGSPGAIVKAPLDWITGLFTEYLTAWEYAWRRGLGTLPDPGWGEAPPGTGTGTYHGERTLKP